MNDDDDPVVVPITRELDLHSFPPGDIPSVVGEYLHEALTRGFTEVRIVHGRGRGVQRGIVQRLLDQRAEVREFWDDPTAHLGATIVRLADRAD
jgi:DNA-nicking Smr family endonuclease